MEAFVGEVVGLLKFNTFLEKRGDATIGWKIGQEQSSGWWKLHSKKSLLQHMYVFINNQAFEDKWNAHNDKNLIPK